MDEHEHRLAAIETLLIELLPWLDPEALNDAERSLRANLDVAGEDERAAKLGAIQIIEDARNRFRPPLGGGVIRDGRR